jgi:hypothetical protein
MVTLAPYVFWQECDNNGDPLASGKVYTYSAGTTTPKATYTDSTGGTPNANPVILDSAGRAQIWLGDGGYKFVIKDSNDVTIATRDNIGGTVSTAYGGNCNEISTNTSVLAADANTAYVATAALTLSLLGVSTAGEGFYFTVKAQGGDVTIDPNGAETIDNAATLTVSQGNSALIICDGDEWWSFFQTTAITESTITLSDVTTLDVSTTKHGFAPKAPNDATKFLDGTGAWDTVKDSDLSTTDITTNNVSTSKHGFAPKAPNDATKYLDGTGAWTVVSGASAGITTIASGNLATGSPTVVDITSIPQTYRELVLYINAATNSVATRALQVAVDTGNGISSANNKSGYTEIIGAVAAAVGFSATANLWTDVTQTAAQTSSCVIHFPAYQSGTVKSYRGRVYTAATASSDFSSGNLTMVDGILMDGGSGLPRTGGITGIRITWNNVGTGVFDGGTYALYGVQ